MELGMEMELTARETVMIHNEQQQMGERDEIHHWNIKSDGGKRQMTEEEQHHIGDRNEIQNWNMPGKRVRHSHKQQI